MRLRRGFSISRLAQGTRTTVGADKCFDGKTVGIA